jgi:hypothetical protein
LIGVIVVLNLTKEKVAPVTQTPSLTLAEG